MKIRTRFILTTALFGLLLFAAFASVMITDQGIRQTRAQELIAESVARETYELGYLADHYLLYRESQQADRWESMFTVLGGDLSNLHVFTSEQQALVRDMQTNQRLLGVVFAEIRAAAAGTPPAAEAALALRAAQVPWSRMAVPNLGLVSDAQRLVQMLRAQGDRLISIRTTLLRVFFGIFGAFAFASYFLNYRRILQGISMLRTGTRAVGAGNLGYRIGMPAGDEMGDLAHSFDGMAAQLQAVTVSRDELEKEVAKRKTVEEELRQSNAQISAAVEMLKIAQEELRVANEELLAARASLEARVAERTAELQQRTEQLRLLANELARAEETERQRLAQTLHDDLQQVLVAVRFCLHGLRRDMEPAAVSEIAGRADALLGQAIQTSRSLTTQLSPPVLHELGLAAGLEWLGQWMAQNRQLAVELQADPQAEPQKEEVRSVLFRSVRELLLNTAKHAGVDRAQVSLALEAGRVIQITVSDAGAGFEPESVLADRRLGGGYGLFSIRERLEHLGGEMAVQSAPGTGTRTVIRMPLRELRPAEAPGAAPAPAGGQALSGQAPQRRVRVLVADDHAVVRQGLVSLLATEPDAEVVGEARDGFEAIDLARSLCPDVILMDITMPRMNGIDATRAIMAELPRTRILALTMHEEATVEVAMRRAGAVGYVLKSAAADTLLAAIKQHGTAPGPGTSDATPVP